jgi:hypothetical protein
MLLALGILRFETARRLAVAIGLLDAAFGEDAERFAACVGLARDLAAGPYLEALLEASAAPGAWTSASSRSSPTAPRCLRSRTSASWSRTGSYQEARRRFVYRLCAPCVVTPVVALAGRPESDGCFSGPASAIDALASSDQFWLA